MMMTPKEKIRYVRDPAGRHAMLHKVFGQWYCMIHDAGEYVGRHRLSEKWGRRTINLQAEADSFKINLNGGAFG